MHKQIASPFLLSGDRHHVDRSKHFSFHLILLIAIAVLCSTAMVRGQGNVQLWGLTSEGGTNNVGTLMYYDVTSETITKVMDFSAADGASPQGSLMMASDGHLYGTTAAGGIHNAGVIFRYNLSSNTYTKLFDMDSATGSSPRGTLMEASNGKLYGTTFSGGANNVGVIFEFDLTSEVYEKLADLTVAGGCRPTGALMEASNGLLYGTTSEGGAGNVGTIFEFNPTTPAYTTRANLSLSEGQNPYGSLVEATEDKLYGATYGGGSNSGGVIFEFDITTNTYTKKVDFIFSEGRSCFSSLVKADDGKLYGLTVAGAAKDSGSIFEYTPGATSYTRKISFAKATGSQPYGSLMQATDGNLYGMTWLGGAENKGVVFKYEYQSNTYTKLDDFDGTNGAKPVYGHLIEVESPLQVNVLANIDIADCDGCGEILGDSTTTPVILPATPATIEITGQPNTAVFLNFTLPAMLGCDGADPIPLTFGSQSGFWVEQGQWLDPRQAGSMITLDSTGKTTINLGVAYCIPDSFDGTDCSAQITLDASYGEPSSRLAQATSSSMNTAVVEIHFTSGCCENGMLTNRGFEENMDGWEAAYGSATYIGSDGCEDSGYVRISGNRTDGSAIVQEFQTGNAIEVGKVYELTACVRLSSLSPLSSAKLRALAFNGALPGTGQHPEPSHDIAIIDISGSVISNEWNTYVFHRWRAHDDFLNFAINVQSDSTTNAIMEIDNICLKEVNDSIPCYALDVDTAGNYITPEGAEDIVEEEVSYFNGYVNDLYAHCNPPPNGLDTWYEESDCPDDTCDSIGGELPQELMNYIENDSTSKFFEDSLGMTQEQFMEDVLLMVDSLEANLPDVMDTLFSIGALPTWCDSTPALLPPLDDSGPFGGRDVIFVHGYRTTPLLDRLNGLPGPMNTWPEDLYEFRDTNGYWKKGAINYWRPHIRQYFGVDAGSGATPTDPGTGRKNRILVVAHPVTQSFPFGIHAVVTQILDAMRNNTGVIKCSQNDGRDGEPFGQRGFVIVSHSLGAPLTDAMLTLSAQSANGGKAGMFLGDFSIIAKRCKVHVALQGAYAGSNYALLLLMVAKSPYPALAAKISEALRLNIQIPQVDWLVRSQTLDMAMTKKLWSNYIDQVPVPVITLAGGHPSAMGVTSDEPGFFWLSQLLKPLFHYGFDDGTLSIDCQCGNPDDRLVFPNLYMPRPGKLTYAALAACAIWNPTTRCFKTAALFNELIYDMGIHRSRAIPFYIDQKLDLVTSDYFRQRLWQREGSPASDFGSWLSSQFPNQPLLGDLIGAFGDKAATLFRFMFASAGCVPGLSSAGMKQPLLIGKIPGAPSFDATKRYGNHMSFIQSTADHFMGSNEITGNEDFNSFPNYLPTVPNNQNQYANCEESRVITNPRLYDEGLVSQSMRNLQGERISGKFKTFKLFKKIRKLWFWKRKHHNLIGSCGSKHQLDYMYDYVLKP